MEKEKEEYFRETLIKNHKIVGDCVEWTGKLNQGYGFIHAFKKTWSTHRLSYELEIGNIPEGFYVCHTCNNKKCFNPHHLYAGTGKENSRDLLEPENYADLFEKAHQTRRERMLSYKPPEQEFLSIDEVAKIFSVHPNTIRRAIQRGFIVTVRIGEGKRSPYRISRQAIQKIHDTLIIQQFQNHPYRKENFSNLPAATN